MDTDRLLTENPVLDRAKPLVDLAAALGMQVERRRYGARARNRRGDLGWRIHTGQPHTDEVRVMVWGESGVRVRVHRADGDQGNIISMAEALLELRRIAQKAGLPA